MTARRLTLIAAACAVLTGSCGGRPSYWDQPVNTSGVTFGLAGGVAVIDDADHRVVILTSTPDQGLVKQELPIGHHFASAVTSGDGQTLFVLSSGDQPVQTSHDQLPSLTVIQLPAPDKATSFEATSQVYTMPVPLSNLAIDPMGTYAVAYAGSGSSASFAENPNEIAIFNILKAPVPDTGPNGLPPNPVSRSIRSYGGTPQQLTFTPLLMPQANAEAPGVTPKPHRLLLIESDLDVTILDLDDAFEAPSTSSTSSAPFGRPDITVRLTNGTSTAPLSPAGLVVDPNEADGRFAFFVNGDSNVWSIQLIASAPSSPNDNDFTPQLNLISVGATPSAIQFVNSSSGLRIAALIPAMSSAVLIEPVMSVTTLVPLPSPYSSMSIVTGVACGSACTTDVALLWSEGTGVASGVALWTVNTAVGTPYRSIEVLQIGAPIQTVLDVSSPNNLKVLATQSPGGGPGDFYVLDLHQRTANPIHTSTSPLLAIAPKGSRMWAYQGTDLAQIDFTTLDPVAVTTDAPISAVYDIAVPSVGPCVNGTCRSLVAIHDTGTLGATVFDANSPQASAHRGVALLLEGP
jgi:hypothetical protein